VNLFISRAGADAALAATIGEILEAAGFGVVLQQWDFANRNFVERMHAALSAGGRVIALLSPEYLQSDHCQAEWQNAIAGDPLNANGRLILMRVAECEPGGLLSGLAYWDLVPVRDNRALLEGIVRDAVREDRSRAAPGGPYWRAPRTIVDVDAIRPVPSFSGRERELDAISEALAAPDSIAAVCGLGGVGKSSIAREYAWRNRDAYAVVWWVNAQTEDAIVDSLLRLGALFMRGLDRQADRRAAAQQVMGSMLHGFAKPVLLIFDNLEDERLLRAWIPRGGSVALATSRATTWSADVKAIALSPWSPETAAEYLVRESGRADLDAEAARNIADALGALPLAMTHAAAALRGMRMMTPGRYLARIGDHLKNAPASAEYPHSVFATFGEAIAHAEADAPGAAAVTRFAACFAPDAIPDELFRQREDLYPAAFPNDELRLDAALGAGDRLSLLAFSGSSRTYAMHRLVQLAARDVDDAERRAFARAAVAAAEAAFPPAAYSVAFEDWPRCERLAPHARAVLEAWGDEAALEAARLAHRCGLYLRERGEFAAAETLLLRALGMLEELHGGDDTEVATVLNNLATVYWQEGRYSAAEPLNRRALAIFEASLGPEHLDVATTLNNLALLFNQQGLYAEAEPLHVRALAIREARLGPEHPNVAASLNNLAIVLCELGRHAEAEPLQTRALAIREKTLGPDHPHVANGLSNLAASYYEQGLFARAEPLHRRALAIWENALGPDHSDVAMGLHNLANDLGGLERFEESEALQRRALAIWQQAVGPEHEFVGISLRSLALLCDRQHRYGESEALHLQALAILERSLGGAHPRLASSLRDLARSYRASGKASAAESFYARALAVREAALGAEHPETRALRREFTGA
jgi:tetratricopeptide (TPR) repeat protein